MRLHRCFLAFLAAIQFILPSDTQADAAATQGKQRPDFTFDIGAGGVWRPAFEGAGEYQLDPVPAFDIRYKDWIFLSSRRGLGLDLVQDREQAWRAGPIVTYRLPRYDGASSALSGLGDVDGTVEAGGYVEYTPSPLGGRLEARQGFGGHHGVLIDMGVSYRELLTDEVMVNLGPGATWASDDYMETYFGISSAQSARSAYPAFDADAGFKDVSFGAALTYSPLPFLALTGFASYERLLGDAAESPLVRDGGSPNQVMVGVTLTLRFGFDEPW
jgi:outer membrane scaffolding protein for murein synthesis (MipA/OmpV family)